MSLGPRSLFGEDAAAAAVWIATADSALRGINHALGNRLFVLYGLPAGDAGVTVATTTAERIEALLTLARQLELAEQYDPEPIAIADAVAVTRDLLAHHPRLRDLTPSVALPGTLPPTLAPRSALVQALLALLSEAGIGALTIDGDRSFGLTASGDTEWITLRVHGAADAQASAHHRGAALRCALALLQGTHAEGDVDGSGTTVLRVPTLARARRGEHERAG